VSVVVTQESYARSQWLLPITGQQRRLDAAFRGAAIG
jgi:hypothetical protein